MSQARGSEQGIERLIVQVSPEKFSVSDQQHFTADEQLCRALAYQAVKTALFFQKDVIRIELGAHQHDYRVADLVSFLRPRMPFIGSIVRGFTPQVHQRLGNTFVERRQNWPGFRPTPARFSLQSAG